MFAGNVTGTKDALDLTIIQEFKGLANKNLADEPEKAVS